MRSRRVALVAAAVCGTAFVALSVAVALHPLPFAVDRAAIAAAGAVQAPQATAVMRAASAIGSTPGITAIVAIVGGLALALRRDPQPLTWLSITALGSIPWYQSLKALLDRPRPTGALAAATGAAFPSGHATQGVAFFGMLAVVALATLQGPARAVAAASAVALGALSAISRIYLEVHWLTDVVGGSLLGGAWLSTLVLVRGATRRRS